MAPVAVGGFCLRRDSRSGERNHPGNLGGGRDSVLSLVVGRVWSYGGDGRTVLAFALLL